MTENRAPSRLSPGVFAFGVFSLFAAGVFAQSSWRVVGQLGGATQAIAISGRYAYVGVGTRLVVLDISDPSILREVGASKGFSSLVEDVAVRGTMVYVAAGAAGLRIIDASTPNAPTEIGVWDSPGYAQRAVVVDSVVYLADGPYGLRLVDVSRPAQPVEVGAAFPLDYAFDVAVRGRYAFVAALGAGLLVADVADAGNPKEVSRLQTPGYAVSVTIDEDTAYVADAWKGVQVVSIASAQHPELIGGVEMEGWAFEVAVSNNVATVASALGGLRTFDVADPSRPVALGAYRQDGRTDIRRVVVDGNLALAADVGRGVQVVNLADPKSPVRLSAYGPVPYARDVAVSGNVALVSAGWGGARIVDLSDPTRLKEIAAFDTKVEADRVAVSGSTACVKAGGDTDVATLTILDISTATSPVVLGSLVYDKPVIQDLSIQDGLLYVTDEMGLAVISLADPRKMSQLGYTAVYGAWGLAVEGPRAYVASTHRGLNLLDISQQGNPVLLGSLQLGGGNGQARDVAASGSLAYVALHGYGLQVVDVTDPAHPAIHGSADFGVSEALALARAGHEVFIASGDAGVGVFDVTRSETPVFSGWIETPGYAFLVAATSDRLLVADGPGGLLVLQRQASAGVEAGRREPGLPARSGEDRPTPAFLQAPHLHGQDPPRPANVQAGASDREWTGQRSTSRPPAGSAHGSAPACLVKTTAETGEGSLSWCLANASSGATITFDPAVFPPSRPATIQVRNGLPGLRQGNVTIDGSAAGVILDGSGAPSNVSGLVISSSGNVIRGIQVVSFKNAGIGLFGAATNNTIGGDRSIGAAPAGQGCVLSGNAVGINFFGVGVSDNVVEGNLIGTDATGMRAVPNREFGLFLLDSSRNRIGSTSPSRSNVISGNPSGVEIQRFYASGNLVTGNIIGLGLDGKTPIGNGFAVSIELGASANRIERNLISTNSGEAITVVDERSTYNVVSGNLIGMDASGSAGLANTGAMAVLQSVLQGWNVLGGKSAEERNVIAGNPGAVAISGSENVVIGNFVGIDGSGRGAIAGSSGGVTVSGSHNFVGGSSVGEGNLIGATRFGLWVVAQGTRSNFVIGNRVGTDAYGWSALPNSAHGITVSMEAAATFIQSNLVSGNTYVGVHIQSSNGNRLRGNLIGTAVDGRSPLGNGTLGVRVQGGGNWLGGVGQRDGNVVAYQRGSGVEIAAGTGNTIGGNSIFANGTGIRLVDEGNKALTAPVLTAVSHTSVTGRACPACRIEVFSDVADQGRVLEGSTLADGAGSFLFVRTSGTLTGPKVTATATDDQGNTSEFSMPTTLPTKPPRRHLNRH